MSVALVLCLNLGTDPPDVVKTSPCARKECWVDPRSASKQKATETIGQNLQAQYERWQVSGEGTRGTHGRCGRDWAKGGLLEGIFTCTLT